MSRQNTQFFTDDRGDADSRSFEGRRVYGNTTAQGQQGRSTTGQSNNWRTLPPIMTAPAWVDNDFFRNLNCEDPLEASSGTRGDSCHGAGYYGNARALADHQVQSTNATSASMFGRSLIQDPMLFDCTNRYQAGIIPGTLQQDGLATSEYQQWLADHERWISQIRPEHPPGNYVSYYQQTPTSTWSDHRYIPPAAYSQGTNSSSNNSPNNDRAAPHHDQTSGSSNQMWDMFMGYPYTYSGHWH